jgi:hypothetical protein
VTHPRLLRALAAAALAAVALAPAAGADDQDANIEGRKYYTFGVLGGAQAGMLQGKGTYPVTFTSGPINGQVGKLTVDTDDFNVVPFVQVFGKTPYVGLLAGAWYGRFEDQTFVNASFSLAGISFAGGVPVRGELKVLTADVQILVTPLAIDLCEVGFTVGVRYFDVFTDLRGAGFISQHLVHVDRELEAPLPQLGLWFTFFLGRTLDLYGHVRGFTFTYEDENASQVEGEAGFAYNFNDHIALGAEYRFFWITYDDRKNKRRNLGIDRIDLQLLLQGPGAYLRVRF